MLWRRRSRNEERIESSVFQAMVDWRRLEMVSARRKNEKKRLGLRTQRSRLESVFSMKHSHRYDKSLGSHRKSEQEGDGLDPKYDRSPWGSSRKPLDRKAAQLCAQIRRSLEFIIPEVLADTRWDAVVLEVEPAPNTSHLLVHLQAIQNLNPVDLRSLEQALLARTGAIRTMVAQSICRKKAPTLSFQVVPFLDIPT